MSIFSKHRQSNPCDARPPYRLYLYHIVVTSAGAVGLFVLFAVAFVVLAVISSLLA